MLNFRKLEIADIPLVNEKFQQGHTRICDETIGGLFMWRNFYGTEIAEDSGMIFLRHHNPDPQELQFSIPCGPVALESLKLLQADCSRKHVKLVLCKAAQPLLDLLTEEKIKFHACLDTDFYDYLYTVEEMCSFSGSHFSGQRNHVHQFLREVPDYTIEEITDRNLGQVMKFLDSFGSLFPESTAYGQEEYNMTKEVLQYFDQFLMFGIILRSGDRIIGFTIGEIVYDTVFVHIEKADRRIKGSYAMLVNLFAKFCAGKYPFLRFMNREEDVGDPGLRKSKLSYKPVELLQKYTVEIES